MSEKVYCTECRKGVPCQRRSSQWEARDLPRGWVLREMVDHLWDEQGATRGAFVTSSLVYRVTTWILCPECALGMVPVVHPEVRQALSRMGFTS